MTEAEAIKALTELAERWPPELTLLVTSRSEALYVIRTPEPGDKTYDDLRYAEVLGTVKIPVGHCS